VRAARKAALNRELRRGICDAGTRRCCYRFPMECSEAGPFVVAIHHTPHGCYAQVMNLPGCLARGANEVEALENVRAMIRTFVTIARLLRQEKPRVSLEISA